MKKILLLGFIGVLGLVGCDDGGNDDFFGGGQQIVLSPNNVAEPGFDVEPQETITLAFPAVDDSIQPNSGTSTNFVSHQTCTGCHLSNGTDVNTDPATGEDVSPGAGWLSSMMGNAMRDPYFRARLISELNRFPTQAALIQNECLRCHAPMLSEQNRIDNGASAVIDFDDATTSGIGRDGISCTFCHQIDDVGLTDSSNGVVPINTTLDIYGPYTAPAIGPGGMAGFTAAFSSHISESRVCAGCHVLRTEVFDTNGVGTGILFTEQATFLEYLNSDFPSEGTSCQDCHMPTIAGGTQLAAGDPLRTPIPRHSFVGGNSIMLRLFRDNTTTLGTVATAADFEQKVQETAINLSNAANLTTTLLSSANGRLQFEVEIENLTGHKLPSGYPSRRMWVHVVVRKTGLGNILFESGRFDENGLIFGVDLGSIYDGYEIHHDLITQQEEVQIYETVTTDLNQNITFSLHAARDYAKDNRIPPRGFTNASPLISDMAIAGLAATDSDFNFSGTTQGTGRDTVTYDISGIDLSTGADVTVNLYFQAIGPAHVHDLRRFNTGVVNKFLNLFDGTDTRPTLMRSVTFSTP